MGHRHRQGQLHFAALGKHLFHVLLGGDRIEGEDSDRPAAADVVVEAVTGLRGGIWAVVWAGKATARDDPLGGGDVPHVLDEPFVEECRFDEDRPRQDCCRRPADPAGADVVLACSPADTAQAGLGGRLGERRRVIQAERFEERPAPQFDLPHPMAANQLGEVPARHLLPHDRLPRLGEEVVGGLELLPEEAADVVVFDAGAVGRIGPEGLERRPQHHRHLDLADDVDELLRRQRHPRPAHLRCRHRYRDGVGAHHFAHLRHELPPLVVTNGIGIGFPSGNDPAVGEDPGLEGVDILGERRHAQRGADLAVVDGEGEPRGDEVDQIVDHHAAVRDGEEIVPQLRLADHGHLRAVSLLRALAGKDRDRDADEIQGVAGGVDGVVPLVDPPQLIQMPDVLREMIEVDRRFETDGVVVRQAVARERLLRSRRERRGAVDDAAGGIGGIGDHVLDVGGALGGRPGTALAHRHRHADERLVAAADARVVEVLEVPQLRLHLRFVFVAVARQPALPPHVGLLGDDRAVGVDVVLQPVDLAGELLDGVVLAGLRLLPVEGLRRGLEPLPKAGAGLSLRRGSRQSHGDRQEEARHVECPFVAVDHASSPRCSSMTVAGRIIRTIDRLFLLIDTRRSPPAVQPVSSGSSRSLSICPRFRSFPAAPLLAAPTLHARSAAGGGLFAGFPRLALTTYAGRATRCFPHRFASLSPKGWRHGT